MEEKQQPLIYFAYGSNMFSRWLRTRTPSATEIGIAYVGSRRLTFDKVSCDGSGKCDMESTPRETDCVYGVLYEIARGEKAELDKAEGRGKGYEEKSVKVTTPAGHVDATAYIATKKEPALRPYHWYKALVVAGAAEHGLPAAYVEWLRTVEPKPDPNVDRRAKAEAALFAS